MAKHIEVIYTNGVFRPAVPLDLDLKEDQRMIFLLPEHGAALEPFVEDEDVRQRNFKTMNDTPTSNTHRREEDEMLPEYDFDYREAYPNRFALQGEGGHLMGVLDPDVAIGWEAVQRPPDGAVGQQWVQDDTLSTGPYCSAARKPCGQPQQNRRTG